MEALHEKRAELTGIVSHVEQQIVHRRTASWISTPLFGYSIQTTCQMRLASGRGGHIAERVKVLYFAMPERHGKKVAALPASSHQPASLPQRPQRFQPCADGLPTSWCLPCEPPHPPTEPFNPLGSPQEQTSKRSSGAFARHPYHSRRLFWHWAVHRRPVRTARLACGADCPGRGWVDGSRRNLKGGGRASRRRHGRRDDQCRPARRRRRDRS